MDGRDGKYPRTFHLPGSPGATADDKIQHDLSWLDGELVVTEKLDGGNLTFTRDAMYARSVDSGTNPTTFNIFEQNFIKKLRAFRDEPPPVEIPYDPWAGLEHLPHCS